MKLQYVSKLFPVSRVIFTCNSSKMQPQIISCELAVHSKSAQPRSAILILTLKILIARNYRNLLGTSRDRRLHSLPVTYRA